MFREELTAEGESAKAEMERLTASRAKVEEEALRVDAEEETLRLLADVRATIAGEVNKAEGVDAVRVALSWLFSSFTIRPHWQLAERTIRMTDEGEQGLVPVTPKFVIEPVINPDVLEGYDGEAYPVLLREPLYKAKKNQSVGSATR